MRGEGIERVRGAGSADPAGTGGPTRARCTRRQMRRVSTGAAVGAAAWIVPAILTATPAAGATLSDGGWATHKWASRKPKVAATHVKGAPAKRDGARSPGDGA